MPKYLSNLVELVLDRLGYNLRRNYWINDSEFMSVFRKVKSHTSLRPDKLYFLFKFAQYVRDLPGDVAEVGVYKGGSSKLISIVLEATKKKIYIFDTFEGFTSLPLVPNKQDPDKLKKGFLEDTNFKKVQNYLKNHNNIKIIKGIFPDSITEVPECSNLTYSFVLIDTDIYQSTLDCLEFFYPRVTPGGVIICDDYNSKKWGGVKKAVDEYLLKKEENTIIQTTLNQAVIIKSTMSEMA